MERTDPTDCSKTARLQSSIEVYTKDITQLHASEKARVARHPDDIAADVAVESIGIITDTEESAFISLHLPLKPADLHSAVSQSKRRLVVRLQLIVVQHERALVDGTFAHGHQARSITPEVCPAKLPFGPSFRLGTRHPCRCMLESQLNHSKSSPAN